MCRTDVGEHVSKKKREVGKYVKTYIIIDEIMMLQYLESFEIMGHLSRGCKCGGRLLGILERVSSSLDCIGLCWLGVV
jgi:hypothetical protein